METETDQQKLNYRNQGGYNTAGCCCCRAPCGLLPSGLGIAEVGRNIVYISYQALHSSLKICGVWDIVFLLGRVCKSVTNDYTLKAGSGEVRCECRIA